jgi:ATP-dependent DNA helicase RecG
MRESTDGFVIAEKDLELRGPGEIIGNRQTGQIQFKIADLCRDSALLDKVKTTAEEICLHHPQNIAPLVRRWIGGDLTDMEALFATVYSP